MPDSPRSRGPSKRRARGPLTLRRTFLASAALGSVALGFTLWQRPLRLYRLFQLLGPPPETGPQQQAQREYFERLAAERQIAGLPRGEALVVRARSRRAPPDPSTVAAMVDAAVIRLTGAGNRREAYRALFAPEDRIAIRTGSWLRQGVIPALTRGLLDAGAQPDRVWAVPSFSEDGGAGCVNLDGVCIETNAPASEPVMIGTLQLHLAKALVEADRIINVAALNTHTHAQLTAALKNHVGSLDEPWRMHQPLSINLALLNDLPILKERTSLVLVDALQPCLAGHPDFRDERYLYDANSVLASRDPLAIDRVGLQILQEGFDRFGLREPLEFAEQTLANAAQLGLGIGDPERIRIDDLTVG